MSLNCQTKRRLDVVVGLKTSVYTAWISVFVLGLKTPTQIKRSVSGGGRAVSFGNTRGPRLGIRGNMRCACP